MERDELRQMILEQEVARRGYEFTTLTVRFADSPEGMEEATAVWRFEGVAGTVDDVVSEILTDIAMASDIAYPPPFELTEHRNVFSWGADGASWDVALTVGSAVVSTAAVVYQTVRDRLAAESWAENAVDSAHTDDEALEYARWFLSSTVVDESGDPVAEPDDFVLVLQRHIGSRHSFEFTSGGFAYAIELQSAPGHPMMLGWERRTL